jgi:hypothetical protein
VTYGQAAAVCPKCGSAAAVHSIEEWAAMAQASMGYQWQPGAPMPGYPGPRPGYGSAPPPEPGPQSGFPDPSQYQQQSGFPDPSQYRQSEFPDPSQYPQQQQQPPPQQQQEASPPQPGYQAGPQPGYPAEPWQSQPPPRTSSWDSASDASTFEEAIAGAVLGAATKAFGRVIGRKIRQAYNERVAPAMAARQEAMRERIAIAQRHPDLRACLDDQVVFLVGGTRVLPLAAALQVRTVEQSDALVAQLRG